MVRVRAALGPDRLPRLHRAGGVARRLPRARLAVPHRAQKRVGPRSIWRSSSCASRSSSTARSRSTLLHGQARSRASPSAAARSAPGASFPRIMSLPFNITGHDLPARRCAAVHLALQPEARVLVPHVGERAHRARHDRDRVRRRQGARRLDRRALSGRDGRLGAAAVPGFLMAGTLDKGARACATRAARRRRGGARGRTTRGSRPPRPLTLSRRRAAVTGTTSSSP